jgi:circadian clock protein KaiC
VLTGTARAHQEVRDRLRVDSQREEDARQARLIERKKELLEQKIAALRAEFAAEEVELQRLITASLESQRAWSDEKDRTSIARGALSSSSAAAPVSASRRRNGAAQGRSAAKG